MEIEFFEKLMIENTEKAFIDDAQFILFGTGGFAREIRWLMKTLGLKNIKQEYYSGGNSLDKDSLLVIGIGDMKIKKQIYNDYKYFAFPSIISRDFIKGNIKLNDGNIICAGNIWTTNIEIGICNAFNLGCTVGHDCTIGSFNQINPSVNISGGVTIGDENLIGTGVQILENVSIGDNIIIGAGAVVTKDLMKSGTYVGMPAKLKNYLTEVNTDQTMSKGGKLSESE